ncbi:MAG TPA: hypothetical protein VHC86_09695 [Opitutaceae bacterium]|nr:hypothetical protein [Opitutaceae bacterium]
MHKSVLSDQRLREAKFICKSGPTVIVRAEDLKRILPNGPDRYCGKIWGPFNIDPKAGTVAGYLVPMNIISEQQEQEWAC